jgi:hypothetical protein
MVAMQLHHNEKWTRRSPGRRLPKRLHRPTEYALPLVQSFETILYSIFSSVHISAMNFGIRKRFSAGLCEPKFKHKFCIFNEKERSKEESRVAAQQLRIRIKKQWEKLRKHRGIELVDSQIAIASVKRV